MLHEYKKTFYWALALAALLGAGWVWLAGGLAVSPAHAAPLAQAPILTPTPGPDGRIIWVVKKNDTLLSISLITGVSVSQLRALNNMTSDTIIEGQKLLIGMSGPPETTVTAGPAPTATPLLPTPSPKPGNGTLCLMLFDDLNGDSLREPDEVSIPKGAISINNRLGSVSKTEPTTSPDPVCFKSLPEGDYTISVAVPTGYNPTTETSYNLTLKAGDETYLDFGAQANTATLAEVSTLPTGEKKSPLLGIIGGLFLVGGAALALFAGRLLKGRQE